MNDQKLKRKKRTRSKIIGTKDRPRLSVFRSNRYLYVQFIDDNEKKTLLGISEKTLSKLQNIKTEKAKILGLEIAKLAKAKKITTVVFDKGSYRYHGKIKALAQGAREGGLQF